MNLKATQTITPEGIQDLAAIAMHAMACYLHSTRPDDFAKEIYGEDLDPSYLKEKADAFEKSPRRAIGRLDTPNFKKLARIALERHADYSQQSLGFESEREQPRL